MKHPLYVVQPQLPTKNYTYAQMVHAQQTYPNATSQMVALTNPHKDVLQEYVSTQTSLHVTSLHALAQPLLSV